MGRHRIGQQVPGRTKAFCSYDRGAYLGGDLGHSCFIPKKTSNQYSIKLV